MRAPNLVGICGQAGAGKDTAATWFRARGYARAGFADPIKQMLNEGFGWTMADWEHRGWKEDVTAVDAYDSEGKGICRSPRAFAQWLGTDVVRNNFGHNAWVDLFVRRWREGGQQRTVVADVRFQNEVDAINKAGGTVIRIVRPLLDLGAFGPAKDNHASEQTHALTGISYEIANDNTIDALYAALARRFA